jgi:hypothetical protein
MQAANYEFWGSAETATKFNGRNIGCTPTSRLYLKLKKPNGTWELYSMSCPSAACHNIIIGKLYVDLHGKLSVKNHTSGEEANFEFHQRGWSGSNKQMVTGTCKNKIGKPIFKITGRWSESISVTNIESGEET